MTHLNIVSSIRETILDEIDMHYLTLILKGYLSAYAVHKATKNTKYGMAYNNVYKRIRRLEDLGILKRSPPASYSLHGSIRITFDRKNTYALLNKQIEHYQNLISKLNDAIGK